jgi:hypothetical protein
MFAGMGLGSVWRLSSAKTRSISAENPTGAKGQGGMATEGTGAACARDLGQGWKISPSVRIPAGTVFTVADIDGPGIIQHIWMTCHTKFWRYLVLRVYWDGEENPSVETPYGDFFCNGWGELALVRSIPIACNPNGGMNSYWPMPFRSHARITLENLSPEDVTLYYQVTYALTEVPADAAYLHAEWRRSKPLGYQEVHTLVDDISGKGQYVGTYLAWGVNNNGWWGEGEIKFFMDGDTDFPTICGTGTEDYFCGSYDFDSAHKNPAGVDVFDYTEFSTPYAGLQVIRPDGHYQAQQRFGMYRWHIMDPIRFEKDLRVTIQALGWRSGRRYLPLQDDIASVAYWYQTLPTPKFPQFPDKDDLEII